MSRDDIAGIQMVQGVPPLKFICYSKADEVLFLRTGLCGGESLAIPKDISKRVARTELKDVRGRVVNEWSAPWEVDD